MTPAIPVSVVDFVNAWPRHLGVPQGGRRGVPPDHRRPVGLRRPARPRRGPGGDHPRHRGGADPRGPHRARRRHRRRTSACGASSSSPASRSPRSGASPSTRARGRRPRWSGVLLADLYGAAPEFHRAVPELPRMLAHARRRAPHRRPGAHGGASRATTSSTSPRGGTRLTGLPLRLRGLGRPARPRPGAVPLVARLRAAPDRRDRRRGRGADGARPGRSSPSISRGTSTTTSTRTTRRASPSSTAAPPRTASSRRPTSRRSPGVPLVPRSFS